jgi:signal transduction histidine kinase/integral membrane sensor domain MASE1
LNRIAKLQLSKTGHSLIAIVIIMIVYYISAPHVAFGVIRLNATPTSSVLYPPTGISLAAVLLMKHHVWIGVFVGAALFGRSFDQGNWLTAVVGAVGSVIEVIVASRLLKQVRFSGSLRRVQDVLALIGIGAIFSPMLNATISTLNGYLAGIIKPTGAIDDGIMLWLEDAVSILVFTPAIVVWGSRGIAVPQSFKDGLRRLRCALFRQRTIEFFVWLGLMVMCSWLILTAPSGTISSVQSAAIPLLQYSPFLFIVWAALRLGRRGTVLCVLIASFVSIWEPMQNNRDNVQNALLQFQISIGVMAAVALVLAAAIAERQTVETQLRRRIEQDQFLAESTLRIRQSLDVNQVLNTTVAEVRAYLNAERSHIAVFDEQGFTEVVAESVVPSWNPMLETRSPRPVLPDIQALFEHEPIRVNRNSETTPQTEFLRIYYAMYQVKASIAIPLWQEGRLYGVLNVHQCSAPRNWQEFEIELLTRLATQVELAIQQGRLYEKVQGFATGLESQVQERTAQLQQQMLELETLNQAKDTLVHAVTHDLRTPVLGMLMVLKRLQSKADETILLSKSVLDRIVESGDRQLSLISSLLEDYSQEPQTLILNYQSVSISELIAQTIQDLQPLFVQNRIRLETQISQDLLSFQADPIHLKQVLENLITNAVQHNPPGITVSIRADRIGNEVKCTISDDGVGISQNQCDVLFDKPFLRGSQNHHRTGLGLGLFLCKQVISTHQGQIGVDCDSKGTEFWFTLPLGEAQD